MNFKGYMFSELIYDNKYLRDDFSNFKHFLVQELKLVYSMNNKIKITGD